MSPITGNGLAEVMKNLILIGFMGTGKTCVGRLLADRLGWPFCDLDTEVEQVIGMSIADYFAQAGEAAFRDREQEAVARACRRTGQVIATGGGVVLRQRNLDRLKAAGVVVCLAASEQTIVERTAADIGRPLLNRPDRLQVIRDLLAQREPQYRQADIWLDTDGKTAAATAAELWQILRREGWLDGSDPGQSGQQKL